MAAFAVSLLLAGCASQQKQEPDAWEQDKQQVMQAIEQLQTQQQQLTEALAQAQKQQTEQLTTNQQQNAQYHALQERVAMLQANLRKLQSAAVRLNESRKITKEKLDKKIEKIAQAIKPAEPGDQSVSKEDEKDHYTAAYLALKSGRYDEAIEKFRELLKSYPNGGYSDQAYYWLGESYLSQNNIERAIGNLEWLVAHYPDSTKHAAAMLRLGMAYQKQKRIDEARNVLQRLIDMHPDSPAAEQARQLLPSLLNTKSK